MIPILYEGTEQAFLNNGLGRLSDAITCKVTEERNGTFELEMTYPITGVHYADIAENRIIFAKTEDGGNNQAFIIYKVSRPLNGIVTVNAQHISYLLNGFVVMPFTAVSCADAINKIAANTVINTPFAYHTDVESTVSFKLDAPRSVRGLLGGEQGSILDTYGGYDYKFDNFNVYLYQNRGTDNGVSIRYGKNLTGLKNVIDATNIYTGIVPYWADGEGNTVYLPERVVLSDHASDYPYKILKSVDFSGDFESQPTEAQLRARAENYVASSSAWKLKNSIDVSFINLGQTEEYKDFVALERVKLCDYVTVIYDKLGVNVKTKVIKTVYNVLTERYDTISLGDTTYTLAQAIQGAIDTPTMTEVTTKMQSAIARATKLIQGGLGGHVVFNTNGDGEPEEILIMDTDDVTTAVNVIRMNLGGIGFSHNGYEGPFETAWTIDGGFNASFITGGTINGNLIAANTISASALTAEAVEELASVHDYISTAIFDDITLWEYGAVAPTYEYIDGVKYIVLDGTGISAFNTNYYIRIPTNARGDINFTVHFKYHIDREVTLAERQRFPFVNYTNTSGEGYTTWKWLPVQTIPADTDFVWDSNFVISNVNTDKGTKVGLYFIPNCKIYLEEFTVQSTVDVYAKAGMDFNARGITLAFAEIDKEFTHNYLPYDAFSNINRWETSWVWGATLRFETITVGTQSKVALVIDGTNAPSVNRASIKTDITASPKIHVSFKYKYVNTVTVTETNLLYFSGYPRDSVYSAGEAIVTLNAGDALIGGQEYSVDKDYTFTHDYDPYRSEEYMKPQFTFMIEPSEVIYIYDLEITGEEDNYKNAVLSFTADGLNSVVQNGSVISSINQSAEQVSIKASKIDLTGNLSLKGQFQAFDANDTSNYIDMTDGAISVYNQNINVFTVSCTELLQSAGAGVFFGDAEDPSTLSRYTVMTGQQVRTPYLYIRANGDHDSGGQPPSGVYLNCEGYAEFHAEVSAKKITTPVQMQAGDYNSIYNNTYFYGNVYNSNGGLVFTSDRRKKKSIKDLAISKAKSFLMALTPRIFKYKEGTSGRYHHGFIAQEVKKAMGTDDWGIYVSDKETDFIGLRYDEIIADLVRVVQDQEKRLDALERKMNDHTGI